MWIPLAIGAGIGALRGMDQGAKNKKRQAANDAFRAEAIRMSPWTGMGDPGAYDAGPTGLDAVLGSGLQGASVGALTSGLLSAGSAAAAGTTAGATGGTVAGTTAGAGGVAGQQAAAQGMAGGLGQNLLAEQAKVQGITGAAAQGGPLTTAAPSIGSWGILQQQNLNPVGGNIGGSAGSYGGALPMDIYSQQANQFNQMGQQLNPYAGYLPSRPS